MLNYIIRKLLSMIPMLLIITFLIYVGVELMPGDVIDFLIPMDQLAEMTPEEVAAFKAAKGLDGPMIVRYFNWLKDICKGDLGYSLQNNMPVGELMLQKLPATIELSIAALLISTVLGIFLGVISALHKGGLADNLLTIAGMIGVAIPRFRVRRSTSNPSITGSMMSRITRSYSPDVIIENPVSPSSAPSARYPSSVRDWIRASRSPSSSSITSIFMPASVGLFLFDLIIQIIIETGLNNLQGFFNFPSIPGAYHRGSKRKGATKR